MKFFETVTDLAASSAVLRRRRYGMIAVRDGALAEVSLRPVPRIASVAGGRWWALRRQYAWGDWCRLYYNQPRRFPGVLAVAYACSSKGCTLASIRRALATLEAIAQIKGSDALLCDVAGSRISERLLARWGWQAHAPMRWHRNFIKRLYGESREPEWSVGAARSAVT